MTESGLGVATDPVAAAGACGLEGAVRTGGAGRETPLPEAASGWESCGMTGGEDAGSGDGIGAETAESAKGSGGGIEDTRRGSGASIDGGGAISTGASTWGASTPSLGTSGSETESGTSTGAGAAERTGGGGGRDGVETSDRRGGGGGGRADLGFTNRPWGEGGGALDTEERTGGGGGALLVGLEESSAIFFAPADPTVGEIAAPRNLAGVTQLNKTTRSQSSAP
ncbi:MAG: hypothetical protein SFV15_15310 [Polyangiaceae bacterium]|nr:hypothetical protein [Polyangiaceae bacterium]